MSWRALINWALRPIFDFAGNQWAETQPAHCARRHPCSGLSDSEALESIALGGGSLAQELRCDRTGTRPTYEEFFAFHFAPLTPGGPQDHA